MVFINYPLYQLESSIRYKVRNKDNLLNKLTTIIRVIRGQLAVNRRAFLNTVRQDALASRLAILNESETAVTLVTDLTSVVADVLELCGIGNRSIGRIRGRGRSGGLDGSRNYLWDDLIDGAGDRQQGVHRWLVDRDPLLWRQTSPR